MKSTFAAVAAACMLYFAAGPAESASRAELSSFDATVLTGEKVTEAQLLGQPMVLIVTPSRDAAEQTRQWANALMGRIDPEQIKVRDVIAVDLPFFMSESDALGRAKEKIPQRFHDMTWLTAESTIERAFNVPDSSEQAFVFVLGSNGEVMARVSGSPTSSRVSEIVSTAQKLTNN
ncbi:hypothetical protein ACFFGH_08095 [Lysobacter korlensis]|uniref:Uncharacterized protein n=1 Tax=Lysobacter korlensis TaxID=553636 RepID=A0ABV6RLD2_9GAMM